MRPIPGESPDLISCAHGCRFSERCPQATERCKLSHTPEWVELEPGHRALCHQCGKA